MNIYDFDNTIYDGDSCYHIIDYGLITHPIITLKSLNRARKLNKEFKKGNIPFERVKEEMLSFIYKVDTENFINSFVNKHIKNIKKWYLKKQTPDDIIVSASYDIWVCKFAEKLGIKYVIATRTDKHGKIIGKNCKREEKVKRINEVYPNIKVISSYSDSESDIPILEIAEYPYVVEGNKLIPYKKGYNFKNKK